MLKTVVKIDAVNQLQHARYAAGMGVEFIGFSLDTDSPNYIDSQDLNELTQWLSGVQIVGELADNQTVISPEYKLDYLQTSNPDSIKELEKLGIPLILEINKLTNLEGILIQSEAKISFFIINIENQLTESLLDLLVNLTKKYPILLKGVQQGNVEKILEEVQPKGISLTDNKNIDVLADVLELIEIED